MGIGDADLRGERTGALVRADEVRLPRTDTEPSLVSTGTGTSTSFAIRWEDTARLDLPETKAERNAAERRADRAAAGMEKITVVAAKR